MFEIKQVHENPEYQQFKKDLDVRYWIVLKKLYESLLSSSQDKFLTPRKKLKLFYDWFNSNIKYDYDVLKSRVGNGFEDIKYPYEKFWIMSGEKYAPMFLHKGICIGFSEMLKDFCSLINIPCRIVRGRDEDVTQLKNTPHAWNEIVLNNERYTIDLTPDYQTFMTPPRTKLFKIHHTNISQKQ